MPPILEHILVLCFERRYPKQYIVICLKSNILSPQICWAGYATDPTQQVNMLSSGSQPDQDL